MRKSFKAVLIAGMTAAGSAQAADAGGAAPPAVAPAARAEVTHRVVTAPFEVSTPAGPRPLFHLFGLPIMVDAPVAPPYAPSAYRDLGGQPESGRDAVLAQSRHDQ